MTPNEQAFLDTIAFSELGEGLLNVSDNGYDVIVGSTPSNPDLFTDYSDHPRKLVNMGNGLFSTAAGRYQILERYFDVYKQQLNIPDFGHESQDKIALQLISECQATDDINAGNISSAIVKCSSRWASLPGSTYGQHTNLISDLTSAYTQAGGTLTA